MHKAKDLREQSIEEIEALYHDLEKEIFSLRNELKTARKLDKPHLLKKSKKDRARLLTILTEKNQSRPKEDIICKEK